MSCACRWKKVHIDDNDESTADLADKVFQASLMKAPILLQEVLSRTFALHFDIEVKGLQDKKPGTTR